MLPKIAVIGKQPREIYLERSGLIPGQVLHFEGSSAKIDDFRKWLFSSVNIARSEKNISLAIWDADLLTVECQAVLLKPLEEMPDSVKFLLFVTKENGLLSTVSSRCILEIFDDEKISDLGWKDILDCVEAGPAECVSFSERIEIDQAREMIESLIEKLKNTLETSLSERRLMVIDECLVCLEDLKRNNVNFKLAFTDFLLRVWKIIKS